jgi:hypothetical protein
MIANVNFIISIVVHTPFWVWLVLLLLIWRGLKAAMPRQVSLTDLVLLPLILAGISVSNFVGHGLSSAVLAGMGIGGLLGIAAGLQLEQRFPATVIGNGRLLLAGEWTTLAVVLVEFGAAYVKNVGVMLNPAMIAEPGVQWLMAAISTCVCLMLVVRTLLRLRLLFGQPALLTLK